MTMTTLTPTTRSNLYGVATPAAPTPVFDRPLTDDELACVIAKVESTDNEHGIVAALAVFDIAAADRCFADADTQRAPDPAAVPAIPLHQWRAVLAVFDRVARRRAPGGESAVLADWVEFGPRISAG
jgi:hypothetical protein